MIIAPVSLFNLVNAAISAAVFIRLVSRRRRTRSIPLRRFVWFYGSFAVFWLLFATPEILVTNPYSVMATNIIGYIFLYATSAIMVQLPFLFVDRRSTRIILSSIVIMAGIVFVVGRLIDPQPHIREIIGGYVYWRPVMAPWLRITAGIASGFAALMTSITFFYFGFRLRANRSTFVQSMYLGAGTTVVLCGSIISFILSSTGGFIGSFAGSLLSSAGLLLMMTGILHEVQWRSAADILQSTKV